MTISNEAVEAAHAAICEQNLDDCLDWRGRCVKAVEAAAPIIRAEAHREGAAAGLMSVDDIWGSEGRSIVRLSELRNASQKILDGEWDKHINWNVADIAKARARDLAERGGQ